MQNLRGLHFGGGGDPWLLPVTAVDGEHLEFIGGLTVDVRTNAVRRVGDPIPAHAELPLLVAICDRYNALA